MSETHTNNRPCPELDVPGPGNAGEHALALARVLRADGAALRATLSPAEARDVVTELTSLLAQAQSLLDAETAAPVGLWSLR